MSVKAHDIVHLKTLMIRHYYATTIQYHAHEGYHAKACAWVT